METNTIMPTYESDVELSLDNLTGYWVVETMRAGEVLPRPVVRAVIDGATNYADAIAKVAEVRSEPGCYGYAVDVYGDARVSGGWFDPYKPFVDPVWGVDVWEPGLKVYVPNRVREVAVVVAQGPCGYGRCRHGADCVTIRVGSHSTTLNVHRRDVRPVVHARVTGTELK